MPPPQDFNPSTDRDLRAFGITRPLFLLNLVAHIQRLRGALPPLTYLRGFDGSHWTADNLIDPTLLAQNSPLMYWKATEGTFYADETMGRILECRQAGMISFLYLFFRRNAPGKPQAAWFHFKAAGLIAQIGGKPICLIDYETPDGVSNAVGNTEFKALCNELHRLGYLVGLYTSPYLAGVFELNAPWVNAYVDFFILAEYHPGNNPALPEHFAPEKIAIHQEGILGLHSWVQAMPGIIPQFDANLLLWPLAKLEEFTGQKWTPTAPPPPTTPPPGENDMTQEVQCVTLGSYLNLRANHNTSSVDSGNFYKGEKAKAFPEFTYVKKPDLPNKEIWLLVTLADGTAGWVAQWHPTIKNPAGQQYEAVIFTAPPVLTLQAQASVAFPLNWYKDTNAQGKPIMALPPVDKRPKFAAGATVIVGETVITADGGDKYYLVFNGQTAYPPTYVPPEPFKGWYAPASALIFP